MHHNNIIAKTGPPLYYARRIVLYTVDSRAHIYIVHCPNSIYIETGNEFSTPENLYEHLT